MTLDVFMIKFDEPDVGANFARLRTVAPHSILIEGISGIRSAHVVCARRATTSHFWIVDADSRILDGFSFQLEFQPRSDEVAVWRAKNPINGLVYGHGGVKLFPSNAFCNAAENQSIDLATRLTHRYRVVPVLASEHRFNMTPLLAWRSAFRECVKLAAGFPQAGQKAAQRLATWCSIANEQRHSGWCLRGARDGRDYALANICNSEKLIRINDYSWLGKLFFELYGSAGLATDEAH
jgi:hypothetical protein